MLTCDVIYLHEIISNNVLYNQVVSCPNDAQKQNVNIDMNSVGVMSVFFFPDDRERNAASETMSLRMLVNVAVRSAVMCVVKKSCRLSPSLGVLCVRVLRTVGQSPFSAVSGGRKL